MEFVVTAQARRTGTAVELPPPEESPGAGVQIERFVTLYCVLFLEENNVVFGHRPSSGRSASRMLCEPATVEVGRAVV
jgi:hypothetical protein